MKIPLHVCCKPCSCSWSRQTVFFLKAAGLWGGNGSSIGQTHQTLPTFAAFCAEAAKEVRFRSWRRSSGLQAWLVSIAHGTYCILQMMMYGKSINIISVTACGDDDDDDDDGGGDDDDDDGGGDDDDDDENTSSWSFVSILGCLWQIICCNPSYSDFPTRTRTCERKKGFSPALATVLQILWYGTRYVFLSFSMKPLLKGYHFLPPWALAALLKIAMLPLPRWNPPRSWCFVLVESFGTSADGNFCWLNFWVNFLAILCSL